MLCCEAYVARARGAAREGARHGRAAQHVGDGTRPAVARLDRPRDPLAQGDRGPHAPQIRWSRVYSLPSYIEIHILLFFEFTCISFETSCEAYFQGQILPYLSNPFFVVLKHKG